MMCKHVAGPTKQPDTFSQTVESFSGYDFAGETGREAGLTVYRQLCPFVLGYLSLGRIACVFGLFVV